MTAHSPLITTFENGTFHVPRTLLKGSDRLTEDALLLLPGVTILLAEPGAGKTEVLRHVAKRAGTRPIRASLLDDGDRADVLVVDAFDEVARQGQEGLVPILKAVRRTGARRILLASRSGEWEGAHTALVRDLFGFDPTMLHLEPLDEAGQGALFAHHHPGSSFEAFATAVHRFDLAPLLGNPQFLLLLAAAYTESGGVFTTRRAVFEDAQRHLARESNDTVLQKGAPTADQRIAWANEIFAVLLLSGSDGVAVSDGAAARTYPRLGDLGLEDDRHASVLDTRLFRPAGQADRHEPVHRIVAEHGAARHLVGMLTAPGASLTIRQLLAIIAPNGIARDELRGLMGWMAALGPQDLQRALIDVDPYAVLANGDPAQLTDWSKCRLLDRLEAVAQRDPYFQRADIWRSFGAADFFTPATVGTVRRLLAKPDPDDGHLQGLLLSLLDSSAIVPSLQGDLERIVLDPSHPRYRRWRALRAIRGLPGLDAKDLFDRLLGAGDAVALKLAADVVTMGDEAWDKSRLLSLLTAAQALWPARRPGTIDMGRDRDHEGRHAVREMIEHLDAASIEWLLDRIASTLTCGCPTRDAWECTCRTGGSKIAGLLLARWFGIAGTPKEPARLCRWVDGMRFDGHAEPRDSASVKALREDHDLRRALQAHLLLPLTDDEEVWDAICERFSAGYGHAGLRFHADDGARLAEAAFAAGNVTVWQHFMPMPRRFVWRGGEKGPDPLRRMMRAQARKDDRYLRAWHRRDRGQRRIAHEQRERRYRVQRRWERRKRDNERDYWEALHRDRETIQAGAHAWWLHRLASTYLIEPDKLAEEFADVVDVDAALRAGLRNLPVKTPTVRALDEGEDRGIPRILLAACLAEMRVTGTLDAANDDVLAAVKTDLHGYQGVSEEEMTSLEATLDRRLFAQDGAAERFLRGYVEPSLEAGKHAHGLYWLRQDGPFAHLRGTLPLEWLNRFPDLNPHARDTLFDLAAQHGDRSALLALIETRCADLLSGILPHRREAQRDFWFLRHALFVDDMDPDVWAALTRDPNGVFLFESRRELTRSREAPGWPDLTARKVERVLDAFIGAWPKVHLPNHWGTGSPKGETAYRFLTDVIWAIGRDAASEALGVIDRLRSDPRFADFDADLRSLRTSVLRRQALEEFTAPDPASVVRTFAGGGPATVGQLRGMFVELLEQLQIHIKGSELDTRGLFYDGAERVGETTASKRIVEWLRPRLEAKGVLDVIEHHLKDDNRCDITAGIVSSGQRRLLVCEVKGQWNRELFSAAEKQLEEKYAIHPDAEGQGIYLVLWFGAEEEVSGKRKHSYDTPDALREALLAQLSEDQRSRLDVVVLDIS
ncbi:MAG: hypothetical protein ACU0CO_02860 [Shimia sp.]